jgi:hypothetical protein
MDYQLSRLSNIAPQSYQRLGWFVIVLVHRNRQSPLFDVYFFARIRA